MNYPTLVLNADYSPLRTISWQLGLTAILDGKATLLSAYDGFPVRSQNMVHDRPAVVVLDKYTKPRQKLRFNRQNILARDEYTCAYCGHRPRRGGKPNLEELTIDHIVPRAAAKDGQVYLHWMKRHAPVTCWENVITACLSCNRQKADQPLEKFGKITRWPRKPNPQESVVMSLRRVNIPSEWKDYLPAHITSWGDYWDVELDPS